MAKQLTVTDLMQMDGQEVYVVDSSGTFPSVYHKVDPDKEKLMDDWGFWEFEAVEDGSCIVYDEPPEE